MKMVNNTIACRDLDEVIENRNGIILASKNNNYKRLEVVHLPSNNIFKEDGLEVGAEIYTLKTAGVEIPIDGEDYLVIKLQDILFIK